MECATMDRSRATMFDMFIIVKKSHNEATLLFKYPDDIQAESMIEEVPRFAIPIDSNHIESDEQFTFVLTDEIGKYKYGHCSLVRNEDNELLSYCFISDHPHFDKFDRILSHFARTTTKGDSKDFVDEVCKTLNSQWFDDNIVVDSSDSLFGKLSDLGMDVLETIFRVLINERSILFVCSSLRRLTTYALSCLELIKPFKWQSSLISILPAHLTAFVHMPCPYIVGLHTSQYNENLSSQIPETTIIEIDSNGSRVLIGQNVDFLPAAMISQQLLRNSTAGDGTMGDKSDRLRVSSLARGRFMHATGYLTDQIDPFIVVSSSSNDGDSVEFDEHAYLKKFPSGQERNTIRRLMKTLLFTEFIDRKKRKDCGINEILSSDDSKRQPQGKISLKAIRNSFRKKEFEKSLSRPKQKSYPKLNSASSQDFSSGFTSFFHFRRKADPVPRSQSTHPTNVNADKCTADSITASTTISSISFESIEAPLNDRRTTFESSMDLSDLIVMINEKLPGKHSMTTTNDSATSSDFVSLTKHAH